MPCPVWEPRPNVNSRGRDNQLRMRQQKRAADAPAALRGQSTSCIHSQRFHVHVSGRGCTDGTGRTQPLSGREPGHGIGSLYRQVQGQCDETANCQSQGTCPVFLTAAEVRQGMTVDQSSILDVDSTMVPGRGMKRPCVWPVPRTTQIQTCWLPCRHGPEVAGAMPPMLPYGYSPEAAVWLLPSLESVRRLGHIEDTGEAGNMLSRVFMHMIRSVASGETVDFRSADANTMTRPWKA